MIKQSRTVSAVMGGASSRRAFALPVALAAFMSTNAYAGGLPSGGTILGVFENVNPVGIYLNSPALGQNLYVNNSATAVYSIVNSADTTVSGNTPIQTTGSSLKWGVYPPGGGVSPDESFSELNFFGGVVPSDIHEPFPIGTFTYRNGTSILSSQIFAAQIAFYDNVVAPSSYLGTDDIYISTTANFYESTSQDADWLNICGNGSNICNTRVSAVETYEGGSGVTVNLEGEIVGDPYLAIQSVSLAPGQTDTGNGFISQGRQLATSVPESSTWELMALGFAGIAGGGLLMRKKAAASKSLAKI